MLLVSDGPAPVPVPDVSGKTFDEASQLLTGAGFTVARADDFSDTVPKDQVIGTDPAAATRARTGVAQITVHVSKGPEMVMVPNLDGPHARSRASSSCQAKGFEVDTQSYLPGRLVRAQSPAGEHQRQQAARRSRLFF